MSPRSAEMMDGARRRLRAARVLVAEDPASAVSAGYYAMLYAARAALSEEDRYARTHRGIWHLFREVFVVQDRFDAALAAEASAVQREREEADYSAWMAPEEEARRVVALAERFVGEVRRMVGG